MAACAISREARIVPCPTLGDQNVSFLHLHDCRSRTYIGAQSRSRNTREAISTAPSFTEIDRAADPGYIFYSDGSLYWILVNRFLFRSRAMHGAW